MRARTHRSLRPAAAALAALSLSVCGGGGGSDGGAGPTVPIAPVPTSTPAPAATTAPPLSASCARLGEGATKYRCDYEPPTFQDDVVAAIDTLRAERPDLFDGTRVLNVGAYYVGVIKILDRKGICGGFDGEELGVKTSDEYNDQYDILTAKDEVRNAYLGTCYPAVFPVSRGPLAPPPPGCSLPSSRELACGRPDNPSYLDVVSDAVQRVLKERPELFDFGDLNPGSSWPRVRDMAAYHAAVIGILVKQGLCAIFDGEEIQAKRTNEFSEHYDVNYSDRYIRTGPGTFRSACHPAAF